jgi:aldehyde dehydrogenase (NAD+)
VSPDYVLVDATLYDKFVKILRETVLEFFGEHPRDCPDLSRIVNENHTRRLATLLQDDPYACRMYCCRRVLQMRLHWCRTIEVLLGGEVDVGAKYIAPTILRAKPASKVMQDEIFGPILPVLTYVALGDAVSYVNEHDKPLALYLFSDDKCVCHPGSFGSFCTFPVMGACL